MLFYNVRIFVILNLGQTNYTLMNNFIYRSKFYFRNIQRLVQIMNICVTVAVLISVFVEFTQCENNISSATGKV